MVDITISLTGVNGDTITFGNDEFILTSGVRGFGIPQTALRIDSSAGEGGVFRYSKRDVRELDLPIMVTGSDRDDVDSKLRRLANLLRGKTALIASYSDGTQYELDVYYAGGAETQYGEDAGATFCKWVLTVKAPQPYWVSVQPQSFWVSGAPGTVGLLPQLSRLQLSSSQALGTITVQNNGDVDAPPIWVINGPATNVAITLNGVGFQYTAALAIGDTITIDTDSGTVVDQTGANKYANLSAAPKLFAIPSGISNISITATGSGSSTKISGFFQPRREVIH